MGVANDFLCDRRGIARGFVSIRAAPAASSAALCSPRLLRLVVLHWRRLEVMRGVQINDLGRAEQREARRGPIQDSPGPSPLPQGSGRLTRLR